ncbi:Malonyl-coenzyme A:anthocyanin 3-O-glucoside-6''-O-malonyltransferase [Glycine soja]|uniref:Malonyl-coenzyme A:anthocyanin 3-O-glucoside-6''-O-malonyltransferase n=1 Tax=Glycine soja TaxID=3848 RepID=A0A0B2RY41_GLYSO|nr:Malonyl-coenzyme A:anthocyanin 3-O-glucoside-6''-O-malonyltransferase [Glycine soja]
MADTVTVKVIEQSEVSPPPDTVPSTSFPLTFFDLPWLCCLPLKRIFFYHFPYSSQHFLQTSLPTLKHSLSLTLQHFFPFSSNLVFLPKPNPPHILFTQTDSNSISFSVAESTADFTTLVSDSTSHVAVDGRAFHHFMKFWASICKFKGDLENVESKGEIRDVASDTVRRTFVLSHDHVEKLKKWVKSEEAEVGTIVPTNESPTSWPLFKRSKLVGENGVVEAAIAIGSEVRHLQRETFQGAETLMSNFTEFAHMTILAGSPKLQVYETDFGWGKPKRSEVVHVDNSGTISLSDCRDKEGRIEVGIALQKTQMNRFITILEEHLTKIAVLD